MIKTQKFLDIKQRAITGGIFFAIIVGISYIFHMFGYNTLGFNAVFGLLMVICFYEWAKLCGIDNQKAKIGAGLFFVLITLIVKYSFLYFFVVTITPAFIIFHLRYKNKIIGMLTGLFYLTTAAVSGVVVLPFFSMNFNNTWWYGIFLIWAMVISVDIGAYIVGRIVGGKKLVPKISPGKTISGLFGGALFGGLVFCYLVGIQNDAPKDIVLLFVVGFLLSIVAQIGDLYQSFMKRRAGVKDSGTILPGHGGIFDRIDGLIMVLAFIPFTNVLTAYFGG